MCLMDQEVPEFSISALKGTFGAQNEVKRHKKDIANKTDFIRL